MGIEAKAQAPAGDQGPVGTPGPGPDRGPAQIGAQAATHNQDRPLIPVAAAVAVAVLAAVVVGTSSAGGVLPPAPSAGKRLVKSDPWSKDRMTSTSAQIASICVRIFSSRSAGA